MFFKRAISQDILNSLNEPHKAVILYGARQTGKTTLIKDLLEKNFLEGKSLFFTGDDLFAEQILSKNDLTTLKKVVGDKSLIVIDEAQRIKNIGLTIKLLIDNLPLSVIASGSASFDLANKISEPLTGRTSTFLLMPLSYLEIKEKYLGENPVAILENLLIYGSYPRTRTLDSNKEKEEYLYEYLNNYLYKDLLMFGGLRKPQKVVDLLSLLALQIGNEVSVAELARSLQITVKSVESYLDILEKMFVIIKLKGFSRNLRKEINKTSKYYFVDLGLRNALIRNFNSLNLRPDVGALFENWFIIEKYKNSLNKRDFARFYFWRTYDQKEIDLIEDFNGKLTAFECKWKGEKAVTVPNDWKNNYPDAIFQVVNSENVFDILGK